jgi:MoaA/NifB/PqqE/SkfB family radical SAM enzyme
MEILEVGRKDFFENQKLFSLHWSVSNNCNYNCDYCGVHQKFEPYLNEEKTTKIINYINHIESLGYQVWAALFGGEPLLHPDILNIVKQIKTTDLIAMTNLSHSLKFFKDLAQTKPDITICSTYHYERSNFEEFKEKINFLIDNVKLVKVKVLWDPRHKEEIFKIFQSMKQLESTHSNYVAFLDLVYHDNFPWTSDDLEKFDSVQDNKEFKIVYIENEGEEPKTKELSYNEIRRIFSGFPKYYMYRCDTGKRGIFISPNGDVLICMSSYFEGVKPIFNVIEDDYNKYDQVFSVPVICKLNAFCCEHLLPRKRIISQIRRDNVLSKS